MLVLDPSIEPGPVQGVQEFMGVGVDENSIGTRVIGCAIEVHRALGPGLLESVYQKALAIELVDAGLRVEQEVPVLVRYKGQQCAAASSAA